jgi:quercetin dioxygenase-like cupin family protein
MADQKMEDNGLPRIHRFITTHNDDGKAIFHSDIKEELPISVVDGGVARFGLGYTTDNTPVDMNKDADISVYQKYQANAPGIVVPGGTVLRFVDIGPGQISPMHRTVSLDYGVVLEGKIELVLDSGETRTMNRGDVAVQRGTMHAWRNMSDTEWGRMMYVLQECKPLEVAGKALEEDYGNMQGVRPSGR